jgi:hypothetical protein
LSFQRAFRKATPIIASLAGRSGSGKTYSALLLARGLVGPEGTIGVIDSENQRSRMYCDDPLIGDFMVMDIYPPFRPQTYIDAVKEAEAAGIDALVIDSTSHEWSGIGGCIEWADEIGNNRKPGPTDWIKPKMAHRRWVNTLLGAQCHVICCLRADYKLVAYKDDNGKQQFAESENLIPETEKRFIYEMTLSATLDDQTHLPTFTKLPKPLLGALESGKLIGIETGEVIRQWVDGGKPVDKEVERALTTLRDVAGQWGSDAMRAEFGRYPKDLRHRLTGHLDELKKIAAQADAANEGNEEPESTDGSPFEDGAATGNA